MWVLYREVTFRLKIMYGAHEKCYENKHTKNDGMCKSLQVTVLIESNMLCLGTHTIIFWWTLSFSWNDFMWHPSVTIIGVSLPLYPWHMMGCHGNAEPIPVVLDLGEHVLLLTSSMASVETVHGYPSITSRVSSVKTVHGYPSITLKGCDFWPKLLAAIAICGALGTITTTRQSTIYVCRRFRCCIRFSTEFIKDKDLILLYPYNLIGIYVMV